MSSLYWSPDSVYRWLEGPETICKQKQKLNGFYSLKTVDWTDQKLSGTIKKLRGFYSLNTGDWTDHRPPGTKNRN